MTMTKPASAPPADAHEPDCNVNMADLGRQLMGCDCSARDKPKPAAEPAPVAQGIAVVETNRCGCHPETCCCQDAVLFINGNRAVTGDHDKLRQIARELNRIAEQEASLAACRADAERYQFLKRAGIIRVFPISSGMMNRGGTRILADTKDWLPGDFTYVIDGKTVDVDAAIDAAMSGSKP